MTTLKIILLSIFLLQDLTCWGISPLEEMGKSFKRKFYTTALSSSKVDSIRVICYLSFANDSDNIAPARSVPDCWFSQVRVVSFKQGRIIKTQNLWDEGVSNGLLRELTQKYLPYVYYSVLTYAERNGLVIGGNGYSIRLVFLPNPPVSDTTKKSFLNDNPNSQRLKRKR